MKFVKYQEDNKTVTPKSRHGTDVTVVQDNCDVGFGSRIAELIDEARGPGEFARRVGVSESVVRKWKNDLSDPSRRNLVSIAEAFRVRLDWLAQGKGRKIAGDPEGLGSTGPFTRDWHDEGRKQELGSGLGEAVMRHMLKKEEVAEKTHLSVVTASGDAMEPTIKDGDTLMVDTSSRTPEGGHIYLVRVGEAELPKRLHRLLDGRIKITHDNRRYGDEIADADSLDILGRVVWKGGYI